MKSTSSSPRNEEDTQAPLSEETAGTNKRSREDVSSDPSEQQQQDAAGLANPTVGEGDQLPQRRQRKETTSIGTDPMKFTEPIVHIHNDLSLAAEAGHTATCRMLLDEGNWDVNNVEDNGWTPLYRAAEGGYTETCRLLLDRGAMVDFAGVAADWTPLQRAAQMGHAATCHLLVERGADINFGMAKRRAPLTIAAENGNAAVCTTLIGLGAELNSESGATLLHAAASRGHTSTCMALLDHFDIDARQAECGSTPLLLAAEHGRVATCAALLRRGANVNISDNEGVGPLLRAAVNNHSAVCSVLFLHGARCTSIWLTMGGGLHCKVRLLVATPSSAS